MNNFLKRILLLAASVLVVISCKEKQPEGVLTPDQMVEVMEEMYIAEEKVNRLALKRDSARMVALKLNERIFREAAINDSIFKRSFDYYMERPELMEQIYTALVDTLQLREQRTPIRPDMQ